MPLALILAGGVAGISAYYYFKDEVDSSLSELILLINQAIVNIPPGTAYFLDLFEFDFGLTSCISALLIRFTIRRFS